MNNNFKKILNDFDNKIKQLNSYSNVLYGSLKYFALIMGIFFSIMPASEIDHTIFIVDFYLLGMGLYFYIYPFLYISENTKMKSIYKVLANTPIDKKVYFKIRYKQFLKFCSKVFLFCIFFQTIGVLLNRDFSPKAILLSFLYIGGLFILSVILGIYTIKLSMSNRK